MFPGARNVFDRAQVSSSALFKNKCLNLTLHKAHWQHVNMSQSARAVCIHPGTRVGASIAHAEGKAWHECWSSSLLLTAELWQLQALNVKPTTVREFVSSASPN